MKTCDRKIDKQKQRTDQDMLISQEDVERIFTYHQQISQLLEECEVCGRQGNIDRVYEIMKHVSQLQESVNKIANPPDEKRNIVCEISGNYMSSRYVICSVMCCDALGLRLRFYINIQG